MLQDLARSPCARECCRARTSLPPCSPLGGCALRRLEYETPFGPALLQAPRGVSSAGQPAHRLVGEGAERSAAVSDDFAIGGQLRETLVELLERYRAGAVDVPRGVLLLRTHVDQHSIASGQSFAQLHAPDHLDVVAEVVVHRALH